MKRNIAGIALIVAIMLIVCGNECKAQNRHRVVANVPFAFTVADQELPAGRYEFETIYGHAFGGSMIVRSTEPKNARSVIVLALPGPAGSNSDEGLIFDRYGSANYLKQISLASNSLALRFSRSASERLASREQARPVAIVIRPSIPASRTAK